MSFLQKFVKFVKYVKILGVPEYFDLFFTFPAIFLVKIGGFFLNKFTNFNQNYRYFIYFCQ